MTFEGLECETLQGVWGRKGTQKYRKWDWKGTEEWMRLHVLGTAPNAQVTKLDMNLEK